jgi:predicted component of type VI protein secretion system
MKLTQEQLKQIIREELKDVMNATKHKAKNQRKGTKK